MKSGQSIRYACSGFMAAFISMSMTWKTAIDLQVVYNYKNHKSKFI